jgi:hypothetical protein
MDLWSYDIEDKQRHTVVSEDWRNEIMVLVSDVFDYACEPLHGTSFGKLIKDGISAYLTRKCNS